MFNFFNRNKQINDNAKPKKKKQKRSFIGARFTQLNKFHESFATINNELKIDYIALTLRARALYKNSDIVNSYVNLMMRSVLGHTGFTLNATALNDDGSFDTKANNQIEQAWYDYQHSIKHYVDASEQLNGLDFDRQVLFNLLIDGEVFIRKVKDPASKYGIRYAIIDALDIDNLYNVNYFQDGSKIMMGIKVDKYNKPISYFIRKDKGTDYYLSGERQEVPADEIIHIYKHLFANQLRGYTPLAPVLLTLNSLDEYKRSEVDAALLQSCWMGVYEELHADANSYDDYDEDEVNNNGEVASALQPGVIKFAPKGYKLNSISPTHPNSQVKDFIKTMLKGICGALGLSYNKVSSDVSETSYSSLRQANIEDAVTVKEMQQFLIDNWKDVQYNDWLKYLLVSDITDLPYSKINKFINHTFQPRIAEYLDPAKQMQAIQLRLSLGLSNPIIEIQNAGGDPVQILNGWQTWNDMLKARNLKLSDMVNTIQAPDGVDDSANENEKQE